MQNKTLDILIERQKADPLYSNLVEKIMKNILQYLHQQG